MNSRIRVSPWSPINRRVQLLIVQKARNRADCSQKQLNQDEPRFTSVSSTRMRRAFPEKGSLFRVSLECGSDPQAKHKAVSHNVSTCRCGSSICRVNHILISQGKIDILKEWKSVEELDIELISRILILFGPVESKSDCIVLENA